MDQLNQISKVKEFALKTLNCFDELAQPEIKNRVVLKMWEFLRGYTFKKILRKPDNEIKQQLFKIHQTLGEMFKDIDMSLEINAAEKLGSVKIPDVGKLAEVKNLTTNAEDILRELKL